MTDAQFNQILSEVPEIQHLIIKAGKMATKSLVENVLMLRHGIDRNLAHDLTNTAEYRNLNWKQVRPQSDKYPELEQVLQ